MLLLLGGNILHATPQNKTDVCDLRTDMRKLWEDHITWTRNVIFNIIDDLPGTNEAVARLLQNQVDIGNAIKPYYGEAAGDSLTKLLYSHILGAANILVDLKTGNTAALAIDDSLWYLNADTIARFLSSANPNWSYQDLHDMMFEHLELTEDEVLARFNHDYAADVAAYDAVHNEILEMADMLTFGIIAQFPNSFTGQKQHRMAVPQQVVLQNMDVVLEQNEPNPFADRTTITYTLPETVTEGQVIFTDINGRVIKTVQLEEKGDATLTVFTSNLSKGIYNYSIVADGKVIDTKRMVHQ
jgi:hypothetical protein